MEQFYGWGSPQKKDILRGLGIRKVEKDYVTRTTDPRESLWD